MQEATTTTILSSAPAIALMTILCVGVVSVLVVLFLRARVTPAERERKRRLLVNERGRVSDATMTDIREGILDYIYSVAGVDYHASQDITALSGQLPADLASIIGPATVKYLPRNPANSIVLCEEWSGLRARPLAGATRED